MTLAGALAICMESTSEAQRMLSLLPQALIRGGLGASLVDTLKSTLTVAPVSFGRAGIVLMAELFVLPAVKLALQTTEDFLLQLQGEAVFSSGPHDRSRHALKILPPRAGIQKPLHGSKCPFNNCKAAFSKASVPNSACLGAPLKRRLAQAEI